MLLLLVLVCAENLPSSNAFQTTNLQVDKPSLHRMKLTFELSGGLEILFDKVVKHQVEFADRQSTSLKELILHIKDNLIKERPDLFFVDGTVRPGILVLVNDCDWELLGGMDYQVQDGDHVVFISTVHGG